nr:hypothetical protein [uncultured Vibrio sp.]
MAPRALKASRSQKGKFLAVPHKKGSDQTLDAIAENIEQLTGMRGSGDKRAVLWSDLEQLGFAEQRRGKLHSLIDNSNSGNVITIGGEKVEPPTQPQNFRAVSGFNLVTLIWDTPTYGGHAYTEVYQSSNDVFSNAIVISTTPASIISLPISPDKDYYYWIRFVNAIGDVSPLNSSVGTHAKSIPDPQYYLDLIAEEVKNNPDFLPIPPELIDLDLSQIPDAELIEQLDLLISESVMENATTLNRETSERRTENGTLQATIETKYYTAADTDSAIAMMTQDLKSEIEDPNGNSIMANVHNTYATKASLDEAVANVRQRLTSQLGGLNAVLDSQYATKATLEEAISSAIQTLRSTMEDPNGTSLGAELTNSYATKTDLTKSIAQAVQELNSSIVLGDQAMKANIKTTYATNASLEESLSQVTQELTSLTQTEIGEINAKLEEEYKTWTTTKIAMASMERNLESSISGVGNELENYKATVSQKYVTQSTLDKSVAQIKTQLSSQLSDSSATLSQNFVTKTEFSDGIESAVSQLQTDLSSQISNLSAGISENYFTKVQTEDQISSAISQLSTEISSSIGDVETTITELAQTNANSIEGLQALWGVKATVGDLEASVGLIAKAGTDGSQAKAQFVVKNADFRMVYDEDDAGTKRTVPVFGTIVNPEWTKWDEGGRVGEAPVKYILAIDTASIKVAQIKDLVAGDVVADSIVAQSVLETPYIRTPVINEQGSNFYVNEAGNVDMNGFKARYGALLNRLSMGDEEGLISYIDGRTNQKFLCSQDENFYVTHGGYFFAKNGRFEGTVIADKIIGDLVSAKAQEITGISNSSSWTTFTDFTGTNNNETSATFSGSGGTLKFSIESGYANQYIDMYATYELKTTITIGANDTVEVTEKSIKASGMVQGNQLKSSFYTGVPEWLVEVPAGAEFGYKLEIRKKSGSSMHGETSSVEGSGRAVAMLFRNGSAFS